MTTHYRSQTDVIVLHSFVGPDSSLISVALLMYF